MTRWLAVFKNELQTGYLLPIDAARKKADSVLYYSLYFKLLGRKITEYNIQLENMYNIDEKGFLIGFLKKVKRVFSKDAFTKGRVQNVSQDGNREWITILATICADRLYLSVQVEVINYITRRAYAVGAA